METPAAPTTPRQLTLSQIEEILSRPLPKSMLKTKTIKGNKITYLSWFDANRILSKYCIGWTWEIVNLQSTNDRIFLVGRLTIPTSEGNVYREATGTETLKEIDKNGELREVAYGDPSSNAESMAFRRACAKFGLGLYLYDK